MKLTVIGFWGGYPNKNEASSGYLLEHEGYNLLIDCGSGVLSQMQNVILPEQLDAVLLSHYHPDHIADIGVLQHARLIQGFLGKKMQTLPLHAHDLDGAEFSRLTYKNITEGVAYNPDTNLSIGPFEVTLMRTNHPVPCFAMRIEADGKALVYIADSSFKEEFISFSKNANVLLCECNFYGHQNGREIGHMTSLEAGMLAQEAKVTHLILTHLPNYGDLTDLVKEASGKFEGTITLAKKFLCVEL